MWGRNGEGQLGDGAGYWHPTPVKVMSGVAQVALGAFHSAALKTDGTLWMWGANSAWQLGDGTTTYRFAPVEVMSDVAQVIPGFFSTAAVKTDGTLWMWGRNSDGQLGDGTTTDRHKPVKVMSGVARVAYHRIDHYAVLKTDGTLWMWGDNWAGQLGDGTTTDRSTPVKVMSGVAQVAIGDYHSAALKTDGTLWTWGDNYYGELGDGTTTDRHKPVKVMSDVAQVALRDNYSAAVKTDGSLWTWGRNEFGQLGDGTTTDRHKPVMVMSGAFPSADLSKASITGVSNKIYTGKAIVQSPTVKLDGKTLKAGTDYALSYKNNTKVGTATVTVTGKGNYTGAKSVNFKIAAAPKSAAKWDRLWGNSEFDTMRAIVGAGWKNGCSGAVVIATAGGYEDALSASGVAGLYGAPVLLVTKGSLPAQTRAELARIKPNRVIVAGGPGAIADDVVGAIRSATGVKPQRSYGHSATDTAAKLNRDFFGKRSDTAILATSQGFHDALAAAPIAYAKHYPIFLTEGKDAISAYTLSSMKACGIKRVLVAGGPAVVSSKVVAKLRANGISLLRQVYGYDYYDTSRELAKWGVANGMGADRMGVATSINYPDALCGAALCGKNNAVLVLADARRGGSKNVDGGSLSFTKAYKSKIGTAYVFGGAAVVSDGVLAACRNSTK